MEKKGKITIELAHPMREQLAEIVTGLTDISFLTPTNNNINTNKDLRRKKISHKKSFLAKGIRWIQKNLGLINIKYFKSSADLSLANGGFLITNKPYATYIEYGPQIFGYNTAYNKIISKILLHRCIMDTNLIALFFRTTAGYQSFLNLPTLTKGAREKVKRIAHPVYPPIDPYPTDMERFKLPSPFKILFIKNRFYEGGGKELLNTFLEIAKTEKDIKLSIITNLKYLHNEDRNMINNHKQITLTDVSFSRKELFEQRYSTHHLAVMPTYRDSFNMTINEAIAAGLPVLTTSFFSIPERVIDGYNGYLCPPPIVPYDSESYIIQEFPKNLKKLIDTYRAQGKLKYIEKFLYEKIIYLKRENSILCNMAHNAKYIYTEKLNGREARKKINQILIDALV